MPKASFYITDIIALAHADGKKIEAVHTRLSEVEGVNNRLQLATS